MDNIILVYILKKQLNIFKNFSIIKLVFDSIPILVCVMQGALGPLYSRTNRPICPLAKINLIVIFLKKKLQIIYFYIIIQ